MMLISGAEGFIAGHFVASLTGDDTIMRFDAKRGDGGCWTPERTAWELVGRPHSISSVVHFGGITDTTCTDERALLEHNIWLTGDLFRFATWRNIPFLYASSASVYGNEGSPLNPYAKSKASNDKYHETMQRSKAAPKHWYGLRFYNVYGSGEEHKGAQASIVSRLKSGDLTEVFEPQTTRDFVHVSDCVEVARWMLKTLPPSGIYDIGTGSARSINEVIALTKAKCSIVPMPDSLKGKYQFHTKADLTKLRAAGYTRPFKTLEEGVKLL